MKNFKKYFSKAVSIYAICLFLFLNANAQNATGLDPKDPGSWIERNWIIAVIAGVILLLFLIPSGVRRTTRTIKKDNGTKTEITTVEEE